MRQRFIEALTYPRMLMTAHIDVDTCPMHGYFDKTLDACLVCEKGTECLWLNSHDEFSVLARKPIEALFEAFTFSIDYIDAYVTRENHNSAPLRLRHLPLAARGAPPRARVQQPGAALATALTTKILTL